MTPTSCGYNALEPTIDEQTMGSTTTSTIADAINESFGSFADFGSQFEANGVAQFGSGWTWLVLEVGSLKLTRTPNQNSSIHGGLSARTALASSIPRAVKPLRWP